MILYVVRVQGDYELMFSLEKNRITIITMEGVYTKRDIFSDLKIITPCSVLIHKIKGTIGTFKIL